MRTIGVYNSQISHVKIWILILLRKNFCWSSNASLLEKLRKGFSWIGKLNIAILFWVGFINNYRWICLGNLNTMERYVFSNLIDWVKSERRKPLLLRGARQVGKTWLVENLARDKFEFYLKVDFEEKFWICFFIQRWFKSSMQKLIIYWFSME